MCLPCTQIHRCGMIHFSQVRLAPCNLSGAQCAPVWVTAYLGAETGGMDSVGEDIPGPNLAGCPAFCPTNAV